MSTALQNLLRHPEFPEGEYWQIRHYGENQAIIRAGEVGVDVFVLLSGQARITGDVDIDAQRHIRPGVCDLQAGAIFGELALFDAGPRSATVTALTDVDVAMINGRKLLTFFESHPDLGYSVLHEMIETLVARLRETNEKVWTLFAWGLKVHAIDRYL